MILTPRVLQPSHSKDPAGFFHSLQKGQGFPAPKGCQGLSLRPGDTGLATWVVQSSRNISWLGLCIVLFLTGVFCALLLWILMLLHGNTLFL